MSTAVAFQYLEPKDHRKWDALADAASLQRVCATGTEVENAFVSDVRRTIWDIVFGLFPENMQAELHLDKASKDGWFAYNCVELVARKGGVQ